MRPLLFPADLFLTGGVQWGRSRRAPHGSVASELQGMEAQQQDLLPPDAVATPAPARRFSLIHKLCEIPLAFVDVETTGASAEWGDRVIELGIARYEGGRLVGQYQQLIDPQRRI